MSAAPAAAFPWRRVRAAAMGLLGWAPEVFWSAAVSDFKAAMDGRRLIAQGGAALDADDIAALQRLMTET